MAAVAISMHELDGVDPEGVDRSLQQMADTVLARVNGSCETAVLAHAHQLLFDEVGFCGRAVDYDDPGASYLPRVLETRSGLPIALCLIYKTILERLGLRVEGINAPGHFMSSVEVQGKPMIVDPFDGGRALSEAEARCRSAEAVGRALPAADTTLAIATHRDWVRRMLRNLHGVFLRAGRASDVSAMVELSRLL
jgi:regulator of sirC expression with transglutaminase-like and TPR domain